MQHITDFPLDAIHLYRQPQHAAMTKPLLKIIASLDGSIYETGPFEKQILC